MFVGRLVSQHLRQVTLLLGCCMRLPIVRQSSIAPSTLLRRLPSPNHAKCNSAELLSVI